MVHPLQEMAASPVRDTAASSKFGTYNTTHD